MIDFLTETETYIYEWCLLIDECWVDVFKKLGVLLCFPSE